MKLLASALAAAFLLVGCHKASEPAPRGKSTAVATVGERAISAEEFRSRLNEQSPVIASRYTTLERKKEFLDGLVRFEVLAQEAERQGLDKDPEVLNTLRKVMVQKLLHARSEAAVKSVPEEESRQYYTAHVAEFVRPERIRLSHIFIASPAGSPKRKEAEKQVAKLLVEIKGKEAGPAKTAFTESAQNLSDDTATKGLGGDLSFRTRDELLQLWGTELSDAATATKSVGEIAGPVATEKGFHLIKLMGQQPGLEQTFESVRSRIESRIANERRSKEVDSFVADLRAKTPVTIDEKELAKVEVPSAAGASAGGLLGPATHPTAPPVP